MDDNFKLRVTPVITETKIDNDGTVYVKNQELRAELFFNPELVVAESASPEKLLLSQEGKISINLRNKLYEALMGSLDVKEGSSLFFAGQKQLNVEAKKLSGLTVFNVPASADQIGTMNYKIVPILLFKTDKTFIVPGKQFEHSLKVVPKIIGSEDVMPEPATLFVPNVPKNSIAVEPTSPSVGFWGWMVLIIVGSVLALHLIMKYGTKRRKK